MHSMDSDRGNRLRRGHSHRSPIPPPPPPTSGAQEQMNVMMQNMITAMQQQQQMQQQQNQQFLAQQQQQNQQFLAQQHQQMLQQNQQFMTQFFERFASLPAQGNVGPASPGIQTQNNKELRLTEFTKIAPQFNGRSSDPANAEYWINEVEKAFKAGQIPDDMKVPLVEFQLKERANDWWVTLKPNIRVVDGEYPPMPHGLQNLATRLS